MDFEEKKFLSRNSYFVYHEITSRNCLYKIVPISQKKHYIKTAFIISLKLFLCPDIRLYIRPNTNYGTMLFTLAVTLVKNW